MATQFYSCPEPNCSRKYKTEEKLTWHRDKCHNNSSENTSPKKEVLFYLCPELNCSKKYRTEDRISLHLLKDHKITNVTIPEPEKVTKENKKSIENAKNKKKKNEELDKLREEVNTRKQLDEQIKREAEEQYKQEFLEKYKSLEAEKLRIEEQFVRMFNNINAENKGDSCISCCEQDADAVFIPCGHKIMCFKCSVNYKENYATRYLVNNEIPGSFAPRGCAMCRQPFNNIIKIYS